MPRTAVKQGRRMDAQILLVGDSSVAHTIMREALEDAGYTVSHVSGSKIALALLRVCPQSMVVLLGTRCGTELLEAAEREPSVGRHAFVLVTALWDLIPDSWRDLARRLHIPIVPKPFRIEDLLASVEQASDHMRDLRAHTQYAHLSEAAGGAH